MSAAVAGWPPDEVSERLVGALVAPDGARPPLDVDLSWEREEPLLVQVRFVAADVTWLVGRELLGEGVVRPVGHGDLQVWPDEDGGVVLLLEAPDGRAQVRLDAAEVTEFLVATYQALGPDEAAAIVQVQIEAELAALLDQTGGVS